MPLTDAERSSLARLLAPATLHQLQNPAPDAAATAAAMAEIAAALAAITPFVPTPILTAPRLPAPTDAQGSYVRGTLLLAHIDGLQQLLELQGAGRQGSEETASVLGALFGALTAEVERHGGGVVKFIGDGLVALFDAGALGEGHAIWACHAAVAMQQQMDAHQPARSYGAATQLTLSVAAHSGRFALFDVGDERHRELLLTGQAMGQLMQVRAATRRGDSLVSAVTARAAGLRAAATAGELVQLGEATLPGAATALPARPLSLPGEGLEAQAARLLALQRYLPVGLPPHLLGAAAGAGDFRPVTLLFANFCNFGSLLALLELSALLDSDLSIIAQLLNTYYALVQREVHRFGGAVHKVDMAPFGDRLMAVFGAPQAHEDDPLRAAQCAQAIRAGLGAANRQVATALRGWAAAHPEQQQLIQVLAPQFRLRAALESGVVFAGVVGAPTRHEYTLVGEPVRSAAQLLAYALSDTVLLSEETQRALRGAMPSEPRAPLSRSSGPAIQVYELGSEPAPEPAPPQLPLIGRRRERELLETLAGQTLQPGAASALLIITGDAGVGKTRLLLELQQLPELQGATVVLEGCHSFEQASPYAVAGRLVERLLRQLAEQDAQPAQRSAYEQLAALLPAWERFLPLLKPLVGGAFPPSGISDGLAPALQRERLHELVTALVRAAARARPLALIVDDLQWADGSSRALLEHLAREAGHVPLLLVLADRLAVTAERLGAAVPDAVALPLDDLSGAESDAFVHALLGGEPPLLLRSTLDRAHGNPLLLEETVHYLQASQLLRRDSDRGWIYLGGRTQEAIPNEVGRMVAARLDQAQPRGREVAQLLAVLGQEQSAGLIGALLGGGNPTAELDALVRSGLLVRRVGEHGASYGYKHALLRDAIYQSMLFAQRRALHAQVAAGLLARFGEAPERWSAVLAQHYQLAEQPEQALPHYIAAARQAQGRYANSEALTLFEQALAIAPRLPAASASETAARLRDIYEPMGDIRALTGEYDAARSAYEGVLANLERQGREGAALQRARIERKIGGSYEQQGKLDAALPHLERGWELIAGGPSGREADLERAEILSALGWVLFRRAELGPAQAHLERALAFLQPHDAERERARVLNRLGGLAWQSGELELADQYVRQSLAASQRNGDLVAQANALANLSVLAGTMGRFARAAEHGEQALQLHEQAGSRRGMAIAANSVGVALHDGGQPAQAAAWFARAFELAEEVRDSYMSMRSLLNRGRALTAMGEWEQAERALRRSLFLATQLALAPDLGDCHVALAELALQRGQLAAAVEQHELGLALENDPQSETAGRIERVAALIAAARGETGRALELLQATEELFVRLQVAPEVERTRAARAAVLARA